MHPNFSCSFSGPRIGFPLLGGRTLTLHRWDVPPLEESFLYSPKWDVPGVEVLTQIDLDLFTRTEILHCGISPTWYLERSIKTRTEMRFSPLGIYSTVSEPAP